MDETVEFVLSSYAETSRLSKTETKRIGDDIPLPSFSHQFLNKFLDTVYIQYKRRKNALVRLSGNFVIVGDLHGHFHDLMRTLINNGFVSETRYIFLGDYIDRGDYSLDVIILLLAFSIKYPSQFILLRGNHEFRTINRTYGFYEAIMSQFKDENIWEKFNSIFDYFPFAALIDEQILCVHAGVTCHIHSLKNIEDISIPVSRYENNNIIECLVWSDPSTFHDDEGLFNMSRGHGVYYTKQRIEQFNKENNIKWIVKGHVPVDGVVKVFKGLISIHTTDIGIMRAGFVKYISSNRQMIPVRLEQENFIGRNDAFFFQAITDTTPSKTTSTTDVKLKQFNLRSLYQSPSSLHLRPVNRIKSQPQGHTRNITTDSGPTQLPMIHKAPSEHFITSFSQSTFAIDAIKEDPSEEKMNELLAPVAKKKRPTRMFRPRSVMFFYDAQRNPDGIPQ